MCAVAVDHGDDVGGVADERVQSLIAAALGVARLLGYRGSALDPVQSPAEHAQQQQADRQRTEPSEPRALLRRLRNAVLFLRERRDRVVEATHGGSKTGPRDTSTRRTIVPRGEQRLHALAVGRAEALFDGRGPSARHSELLQVAQARCQLLVLAQALRDGGVRPSLAPAGQPSPRQRVNAGAERTRALHDRLSLPRPVRFAASVIRHHQHPRDHGQGRHEDGHDAQRPPAQKRARAQVTTSSHTLRDRWSARGLKPWEAILTRFFTTRASATGTRTLRSGTLRLPSPSHARRPPMLPARRGPRRTARTFPVRESRRRQLRRRRGRRLSENDLWSCHALTASNRQLALHA